MNLLKFFEKHSDEYICIEVFKLKCIEMEVIRKKHSYTEHYFRKTDLKIQSKKCVYRLSLRSGTVMENSKLPFQYWMIYTKSATLSKKSFFSIRDAVCWGYKGCEPI